MNLLALFQAVAPWLASAAGLFLLHRLRTPKDHERAALLVAIADSVAATVVQRFPSAPWATLIEQVVKGIADVLGPAFPTQAIQREATRALTALGKSTS